jgi:hypothetical protein
LSDTRIRERPLRPDDVPALLELFQRSFGRAATPDHYRWKLRTRPSPADNVAIAVDTEDRPVFHSAGIPCRCRIGGVERWVMVGVDVMTAASHRRQGVHTTYSNALYARWKAAGVAAVIGFTSEQWGSTVAKVGLRPLAPLVSLVLPLRPERALARKSGLRFFEGLTVLGNLWRNAVMPAGRHISGLQIEEIREAGEEMDLLWVAASPRSGNSLVRDRAWVAWRYLASPQIRYRVFVARRGGTAVGYAALRGCESTHATIAEIFTAPGEDSGPFDALLRTSIAMSLDGCAESLRTLAVPGTWLYRNFRRHAFMRDGAGMIQYIPLDPQLAGDAIGVPSDWYFTPGDFDAV